VRDEGELEAILNAQAVNAESLLSTVAGNRY
jgi:hypothetical protein